MVLEKLTTQSEWCNDKHLLHAKNAVRELSNASEWNGATEKVVAFVDASWSRKSVAGGIIVWGGSLIKSWSRRFLAVPCLSSKPSFRIG